MCAAIARNPWKPGQGRTTPDAPPVFRSGIDPPAELCDGVNHPRQRISSTKIRMPRLAARVGQPQTPRNGAAWRKEKVASWARVSRTTRRSRSLNGPGLRPVASPFLPPRRHAQGCRAPTPTGEGLHPIHPPLCTHDSAAARIFAATDPGERSAGRSLHLGPPPDLAARKKARSGSEKRQRGAGILVKLTPADHQRVKAEAAAAGISAAGYLVSGRLGEERAFRAPAAADGRSDEPALMRALAAFHRATSTTT